MKIYYTTLLLLLSIFYQKSIAQCPLNFGQNININTNGLIVYYPFNGNVNNLGSGSYTTTVNGANYSTGICGQGMHFDGIDDNIQLTPFVSLTSDFTIAAWVFVDSLTENLAIFATREQCNNTYRGYSQGEFGINYYIQATGGSNRIRYVINTHQNCTGWSAGDRYYVPNYTYSSGSWHFIAITVEGNSTDSRVAKVFLDCQQYSITQYLNYNTGPSFNPSNNNKSFIGAASDILPWNFTFNGTIDEFRIYNRAINASEMNNLYYQCKPIDISIHKHKNPCLGDSAQIELINTQKGVSYQLYDSSNHLMVGPLQNGGCNNLIFNTGIVLTPTDFYIKASSNSCNIVLDTVISLYPIISNSYITHDTLELCDGDSVYISGKFYISPSTVYDSLYSLNQCDSVIITHIISRKLPIVDLGNDTIICDGDSVLLQIPNNYYTILWSNGSINNSIFINSHGTYWVEVSDSICVNQDSIEATNLSNSYIQINDSSFCEGEIWTISLPSHNTYLWSTGSNNPYIAIQDSGQYWVTVTDICKHYTEDFSVQILDCSCMMTVPNVFTPNNDGLNDYFYPVINCIFDEYHIVIYNRWGQLIFESFDQNAQWNGHYKSTEVTDGVYFYLITYRHFLTSNKEGQRSGSITIFR